MPQTQFISAESIIDYRASESRIDPDRARTARKFMAPSLISQMLCLLTYHLTSHETVYLQRHENTSISAMI